MNHTLYKTPTHEVGAALDRKYISDKFHAQEYPSFGYSTGPYRVYDHATEKGTIRQMVQSNKNAQKRFESEVLQLEK